MPKKKAGSAAANPQRPQPVAQPSSNSMKSAPAPPASKTVSALSATLQETSDPTEEALRSPSSPTDTSAPAVNRKKQKRRQKQAAKLAEQEQQQQHDRSQPHLNNGRPLPNGQGSNGHIPYPGRGPQKGYFTEDTDYVDEDYVDDAGEVEDAFYSGDEADLVDDPRSDHMTSQKSKKKKKNRKTTELLDEVRATSIAAANLLERSALATQQALANAKTDTRTPQQKKRDQIWNDSKNQERENIKQFWLELGEEDRKALVQIEKEAVLRKMKEQKSQCNCTVCGRKRMAIEEELEVLYDAYYDELEHYAHPSDVDDSRRIMPPPRPRDHPRRPSHSYSRAPPGHFEDDPEEDEDEFDDEFDDDEDDELYSDDELDEISRMPEEFYNFSNSLRVKNGILTVADDLLKNDGKEFINMMDKLADRRMQREEEARFPQNPLSHQNHHNHNHGPIDEDDYDDEDEEDDEEYDSQDFDEDEDDMDALTEEQRMAEGRRMFQVFAARMFEQRVLTAYREKVARERQQKLIEELEEEDRLDNQREAKKARDSAKKKEKKRLAKLAKDEEKARKEAEKAAQEAEARALEERKQEEQRQRKEEQRKKREAEKKAQEEERLRKEADRQKKAQQERERQAEVERKQREAKEKEKKKRQEAQKKEREEREAREKEVREQRQKEERRRKAKEEETRRQKEAAAKGDREAKDKAENLQSRRPPVAMPPGLHPQGSSSTQSPHFAVATPIVPKAPTPARPRQASQQGHSHGSSPRSQQAVTDTSLSSNSPVSGVPVQTPLPSLAMGKPQMQQPQLHHPQPSAPMSPLNQTGRQNFPFNYSMQGMHSGHPPPPGMLPNMMPQHPNYPSGPMAGQYRGFGFPNNMPFPPGMNGRGPYPVRQGSNTMQFPAQGPMQPPGTINQSAVRDPARNQPHSRQPSGSLDRQTDSTNAPQPIGRPAPIGPSSTTPDKQGKRKSVDLDVDNVATQLGSKALLEDSDEPLSAGSPNELPKQSSLPPGSGRVPSFTGFADPIQKHDAFNLGPNTPQTNAWGFGTSPGGSSTWGPSPPGLKPGLGQGGWPTAPSNGPAGAFGMGSSLHRPHHASRPAMIRVLAAQACQQLGPSGFHPIHAVLNQVSQIKPAHEPPVQMTEILEILDTEGNHQNGGGAFSVQGDSTQTEVRFDSEDNSTVAATSAVLNAPGGPSQLGGRGLGVGGLGDIGSPVIGHGQMFLPPHHPPGFGGIGSNRT